MNPAIQALIDRTREKNRAAGRNVKWTREDGTVDEWSFSTVERAQAFLAKCERRGLKAEIAS